MSQGKIPEVCTIRGIRRYVMQKVWKRIQEAEAKGEIITLDDFGRLIREAWREAKEEYARVCRLT